MRISDWSSDVCSSDLIAEHTERGTKNPQIGQGFESPQRVAVEFALIIDAAHAGTLNEVVRQDLIPEIHHLFCYGNETVAANIKAKALMFHCPADPAHISSIFLNYRDTIATLSEQISSRTPCRTCDNDGYIYILFS